MKNVTQVEKDLENTSTFVFFCRKTYPCSAPLKYRVTYQKKKKKNPSKLGFVDEFLSKEGADQTKTGASPQSYRNTS